MRVTEHEIAAVTKLPGPDRYRRFVKVVADAEEAWGLWHDGWALASTDDGRRVFPLWPAREYAALCATADWEDYEPAEIPLDDLIGELLPKLARDRVLPGVFMTQADKGTTPEPDQLLADLERELAKY